MTGTFNELLPLSRSCKVMARGLRRLVAVLTAIAILVVTISIYSDPRLRATSSYINEWIHAGNRSQNAIIEQFKSVAGPQYTIPLNGPPDEAISQTHHEVFSQSSQDGKYLTINFGDYGAINPNIIPHPQLEDTWILVAQQQRSDISNTVWFAELACNAVFENGILHCVKSPLILPIAATDSPHCAGEFAHFSWNVGPHDARVFYGPHNPYVIYGSNSAFACFGQWIQDLRLLVDWGREEGSAQPFRRPTDLQRPPPYGVMEKNWFLFWDVAGNMYLHYDFFPKRVFAKVEKDGSVGEDLATVPQTSDEVCMAKHLPSLPPSLESIHQATNSLSIVLCKRSDPSCEPRADNTYSMTIIQHKAFYSLHSVYEPYVVLFQPTAPFALHAISSKPIWIHGRGKPGEKRPSHVPEEAEWNQSEMFYVTSFSWKTHGQRYLGHIDDTILLSFGIEDASCGVIDVLASDLLESLALC